MGGCLLFHFRVRNKLLLLELVFRRQNPTRKFDFKTPIKEKINFVHTVENIPKSDKLIPSFLNRVSQFVAFPFTSFVTQKKIKQKGDINYSRLYKVGVCFCVLNSREKNSRRNF